MSLLRKTSFNYIKCNNNNNNNGYSWLPTVYTGKPVEKSNGSLHSVLEASENMGYDLRRCNFSTFSSLFCKFGCILVPPGQMLDHFIVLCLCTRFFHPGSVYMLSTQQRIQQLEMKFFRRKRPALLFLRNTSEFAIAQIPLLLLHNQLALIKFRKICAPIKWH